MSGVAPFEALAKLPEPCKPESLGMDMLHSVFLGSDKRRVAQGTMRFLKDL